MKLKDQLQPDEEILFQAHPSRVVLLPLLAVALLLLVAGVLGWQAANQPVFLWLGGALALVALGMAGVRHLRLSANEYLLTDRRVVRQTGILAKSSTDLYLDKINNVELRQSLWGRILGFGDVEIDTASETGETVFPMVNHSLEFRRAILAAAEAYRSGRRAPAWSAPAVPAAPAKAAGPAPSSADRMRELKRLLDEGLISPAEFEAKRKTLLDDI